MRIMILKVWGGAPSDVFLTRSQAMQMLVGCETHGNQQGFTDHWTNTVF